LAGGTGRTKPNPLKMQILSFNLYNVVTGLIISLIIGSFIKIKGKKREG
jgi:hypothetical protein